MAFDGVISFEIRSCRIFLLLIRNSDVLKLLVWYGTIETCFAQLCLVTAELWTETECYFHEFLFVLSHNQSALLRELRDYLFVQQLKWLTVMRFVCTYLQASSWNMFDYFAFLHLKVHNRKSYPEQFMDFFSGVWSALLVGFQRLVGVHIIGLCYLIGGNLYVIIVSMWTDFWFCLCRGYPHWLVRSRLLVAKLPQKRLPADKTILKYFRGPLSSKDHREL